jgi:hypothetical protein
LWQCSGLGHFHSGCHFPHQYAGRGSRGGCGTPGRGRWCFGGGLRGGLCGGLCEACGGLRPGLCLCAGAGDALTGRCTPDAPGGPVE